MVLILTAYGESCLGHSRTEQLVVTPKYVVGTPEYEIVAFTANTTVRC